MWHPIETAPKDGTVVFFHVPGVRYPIMGRGDDWWNRAMWLQGATHWHPMLSGP